MPRPKKVTDEQIVDAARDVFVAQGVGASMDVIARQLGVTAPVLFMRFGTKLNLFYRAVVPDRLPWVELSLRLRRGPDNRPIEAQLNEVGEHIILLFAEILAVVRLCAKNAVSMDDIMNSLQVPAVEETIRALGHWLSIAHRRGSLTCPEPDAIAELFVSALYWQVGFRNCANDGAPKRDLRAACTTTVRALLPTVGLQPRPRQRGSARRASGGRGDGHVEAGVYAGHA